MKCWGFRRRRIQDEIAGAFAKAMGMFGTRPVALAAQLSAAFETLRNPTKRRAYDSALGLRPKPQLRPWGIAATQRGGARFADSAWGRSPGSAWPRAALPLPRNSRYNRRSRHPSPNRDCPSSSPRRCAMPRSPIRARRLRMSGRNCRRNFGWKRNRRPSNRWCRLAVPKRTARAMRQSIGGGRRSRSAHFFSASRIHEIASLDASPEALGKLNFKSPLMPDRNEIALIPRLSVNPAILHNPLPGGSAKWAWNFN